MILGETDYVAYQHTFKEVRELAAHGASYIATTSNNGAMQSGLMLDADWMSAANDEQKGAMGGIISGICYDTVFQSRTYHSDQHSRFQSPCFLFTSFKQRMDAKGYRYFLRMLGVVEWKELGLMWIETIYELRLAPH